MLFVLALFVSLYVGAHYYIFRKALVLFPSSQGLLLCVISLLLLSPILAELLKRSGLFAVAVPLGWIGYIWMGFAFLFFSLSVAMDLVLLLLRAAGGPSGGQASAVLASSAPWPVLVTVILAAAATGYGLASARQIKVERVRIPTRKLAAGSGPFRIVQISDLHLDLWSDERRLRRIVETVQAIRPDVVVSTGDLVDLGVDRLGGFADMLGRLEPRLGKFAVTGNHEAYLGFAESLAVTRRAGFEMLSYEGTTVDGVIHIAGVDDPAVRNRIRTDGRAERALLQRYPKEEFTLLLKHQPRVDRASVEWFDLQLSGHTHGGQIFPFQWFVRLVYPARTGLSQVGPGTWLYVSRGTGTWGPPIRLFAPSELTVIELEPSA